MSLSNDNIETVAMFPLLVLVILMLGMTAVQEFAPELGFGNTALAPELFLAFMAVFTTLAAIWGAYRYRGFPRQFAVAIAPFILGYVPVKAGAVVAIRRASVIDYADLASSVGTVTAIWVLFAMNVILALVGVGVSRYVRRFK